VQNPDNFVLSALDDFAIYLPAVNPDYQKFIDSKLDPVRPIPSGFSLDDLAFWSGTSQLWNHKHLLHSIGGYKVGTDTRGPLFRKAAGDFCFVGDCGGFQIGKGTLDGLKYLKQGISGKQAVEAWGDNYDAKLWIINWLERYSDYAMTIDMPLWATTPAGINSPFHKCTEDQLLAMTLKNLKLIDANKKGRTKWLNVIQGTTPENTVRWWNEVNWFRDGGWSLAGAAGWRGGLANVLSIVLLMRDEGAFEPGLNWLHVLGVSQPKWFIALSAIQRQLRKINPKIQLSCDSASPFQNGGAKDEYALPVALGPNIKDWSVKFKTLTGFRMDADPSRQMPTELHSPIGDHLMMHHLVVDAAEFSGRRIDNLTNKILTNHNIWVYLDAARRANNLAFLGNRSQMPTDYAEVLDCIEDAFTSSDWQTQIRSHRPLLDRFELSQYA
jgi:hypothetical protein